jgi:hypothetical protein
MNKNVLVYISGPMTAKDGRTIEDNVAEGLRVYWELLQAGIPAFCPHLSGAFPTAWSLLPHAEWLAYDFAIIDRSTHVLMMPRWESSTGAKMEHQYAIDSDVPVFYTMKGLFKELEAFTPVNAGATTLETGATESAHNSSDLT